MQVYLSLCLDNMSFCRCSFASGLLQVNLSIHVSLVTRKPVFGVYDQERIKLAWTATGTSLSLEIWDLASAVIILSRQRRTDCVDA